MFALFRREKIISLRCIKFELCVGYKKCFFSEKFEYLTLRIFEQIFQYVCLLIIDTPTELNEILKNIIMELNIYTHLVK